MRGEVISWLNGAFLCFLTKPSHQILDFPILIYVTIIPKSYHPFPYAFSCSSATPYCFLLYLLLFRQQLCSALYGVSISFRRCTATFLNFLCNLTVSHFSIGFENAPPAAIFFFKMLHVEDFLSSSLSPYSLSWVVGCPWMSSLPRLGVMPSLLFWCLRQYVAISFVWYPLHAINLHAIGNSRLASCRLSPSLIPCLGSSSIC